MGLIYYFLNDYEKSEMYYIKSLEIDDSNFIVWDSLGVTLTELKNLFEAEKSIKRSLLLNKKWYLSHYNLANILDLSGNNEEAIIEYNTAIALNSLHRDSYFKLGVLYQKQKKYNKAMEIYEKSILLDDTYYPNYVNLAFCYVEQQNYIEASNLLKKVLQNNSLSDEIKAILFYNLGTVEQKMLKFDASIDTLKTSITHKKDFFLARWNLSLSLLTLGKLKEAWPQYEFRFKSGEVLKRTSSKPYYNGESLKDYKLLIWAEQGLGDSFQFGTCLLDLEKYSDHIIFECDPRLVDMFQRRFSKIVVRPFSNLDDFDFQIGLGSLPKYFRNTIESFPKKLHYITPKKDLIKYWKKKLDLIEGRKIGFCWRSSYTNSDREQFYSKIQDWKDIMSTPHTKWIVLQYDNCDIELEEIKQHSGIEIIKFDIDLENDLENTLALMSNLDMVISVSTTISEMSGSINIPTWRIDRKNNWFNHNQKIKPWYPSSRVIEYIDTPSDALKIAEQDLKELLNGPPIMDI